MQIINNYKEINNNEYPQITQFCKLIFDNPVGEITKLNLAILREIGSFQLHLSKYIDKSPQKIQHSKRAKNETKEELVHIIDSDIDTDTDYDNDDDEYETDSETEAELESKLIYERQRTEKKRQRTEEKRQRTEEKLRERKLKILHDLLPILIQFRLNIIKHSDNEYIQENSKARISDIYTQLLEEFDEKDLMYQINNYLDTFRVSLKSQYTEDTNSIKIQNMIKFIDTVDATKLIQL